MTDHKAGQRRLFELLAGIDFGRRYFDFYEARRGLEGVREVGPARQEVREALARTALAFRYDEPEDFYQHRERHDGVTLLLHVAVSVGTVDLMLYVRTAAETLGGPYTWLAREAILLRDPSFSPTPRAPKLPFSTVHELHEAIDHGVRLFGDARDAILASGAFGGH